MTSARFVQFAGRSDAYRFVAELRRLTDLAPAMAMNVHDTDCGLLVAIPTPIEPYGGVASMAERFHGHVLASEPFESLAAALERARETLRKTQALVADAQDVAADAASAVDASRVNREARNTS